VKSRDDKVWGDAVGACKNEACCEGRQWADVLQRSVYFNRALWGLQ